MNNDYQGIGYRGNALMEMSPVDMCNCTGWVIIIPIYEYVPIRVVYERNNSLKTQDHS